MQKNQFVSLERLSNQVDVLRYQQYPEIYALLNGYGNYAKNLQKIISIQCSLDRSDDVELQYKIDDFGILHIGYQGA